MASNKDLEKVQPRSITVWPQWLAAHTLSLAVIVSGLANGWASPYLAQLTSTEADMPLRLTSTEASWVASLLNLGRLIGALLGALCQEYVGRKTVLLLGGIPMAASWVFSICATSVLWLYASRFSSGIGSGMIWPALSLYLGEIADPKIRGSLISMNVNAASFGTFLGNVMGPYLSMEMFGYVSLVPNILFLALFSLIPESPYHYVLHNDMDRAEASLKWFKRDADVKAEIQDLQEFVEGAGTSIIAKLREFFRPANFKNALAIMGLYTFFYFSGYGTMVSYAEIIVKKSKTTLTPSTVVIALGVCTTVAGSTAIVIMDKIGRKTLLMGSSLGVAISLGCLGLHFHLLSLGFNPVDLTWLPVTSLLCFNFCISYGLVPIPNTLVGETFGANLKNPASLFISSFNAVLAFTCARTYQPLLDLIGEKFVFWTYGFLVFTSIPYVYFFISETKGKSLLEIQRAVTR
ncbi:hypothetical protein KM043_011385 [Ampulex compressa]|nr:hypothetical protein KM043_011385 [Ampulex compressa]